MKSILIIEDEEVIAYDIERRLIQHGYNTYISCDKDDILTYIADNQVDLVLADIELPGANDGVEIVASINNTKSLPVVFLTAYDESEIMERAKHVSPYAYLLKPFDEKELLMIVSLAIQHNEYEKRLVFKEQWIRSVIDNIAEGVIVVDISGNITFANVSAREDLSLGNESSWMNRPFAEQLSFLDDAGRLFSSDIFQRYTNTKVTTYLPNISIAKHDDVLATVDCSLNPFFNHDGNVIGTVVSFKKRLCFVS